MPQFGSNSIDLLATETTATERNEEVRHHTISEAMDGCNIRHSHTFHQARKQVSEHASKQARIQLM